MTTAIQVPYINLTLQHQSMKKEILSAVESVLDSGFFISGPEVEMFEERFANYCETKYAVGVSNGTDALILAMKALNIGYGDEVITAPNSFLASASSIALVGAKPVFVDVCDDYNLNPEQLVNVITNKTKAIIPVHLTGRPANMDRIIEIAEKYDLAIIEDCAQAVGAEYKGKRVGSFGIMGCFSLHPLKNLNACGDGGVITTNDKEIYELLLKMRNHGLKNRDECQFWGHNARLDAIQAAILNIKLNYLEEWTMKRRDTAAFYRTNLEDVVDVPVELPHEFSVYHTFIIQTDHRDELQQHLAKHGIDSKVHYPIPIHLQESARSLGHVAGDFPVTEKLSKRILSLPIYPELTNEQKEAVVKTIRRFYE